MAISWSSSRGQECDENNDAAAVLITEDWVVAIVTDAARSRTACHKGRGGLAPHWSRLIIERVAEQRAWGSSGAVTSIMQTEQALLRHTHLHEIGSYCCVSLSCASGDYFILQCGDCLVGEKVALSDRVSWLCRPATLAEQFELCAESVTLKDSVSATMVLTRYLNARRFHQPYCVTGCLAQEESMVICTDGYWRENTTDDASILELNASCKTIYKNSDCENCLIVYR